MRAVYKAATPPLDGAEASALSHLSPPPTGLKASADVAPAMEGDYPVYHMPQPYATKKSKEFLVCHVSASGTMGKGAASRRIMMARSHVPPLTWTRNLP